jgi:hypothetical protein
MSGDVNTSTVSQLDDAREAREIRQRISRGEDALRRAVARTASELRALDVPDGVDLAAAPDVRYLRDRRHRLLPSESAAACCRSATASASAAASSVFPKK